ncbi:MAG: hypothetical protein ACTHM0_06980 [Sphingomonas sp.]
MDDRPARGSRRKRAALIVALLLAIVVIIFVGYNVFYIAAYS